MYNRETIKAFLLENGANEVHARNLSTYIEAFITSTGYSVAAVRSETVNEDHSGYVAELKGGDNRDITITYECVKRTAGLYEHTLNVKCGEDGFSTSSLESRPFEEKTIIETVVSYLLPDKEEEVEAPAEEPVETEGEPVAPVEIVSYDADTTPVIAPNPATVAAIEESLTDTVETVESVEALVQEATEEAPAKPAKKAAAKKKAK